MLPESVQIQIIADMIRGAECELPPAEAFGDTWRLIYEAACQAPEPGERLGWVEAEVWGRDDAEDLRAKLDAALDGGGGVPSCPTLADLRPTLRPIRWLWKRWLPQGLLSMLIALSGAGKTWVALDLARRVIMGEPWPDGSPMPEEFAGRPVLYVDAENIPDVLNARLSAWAVDPTRLLLMRPERYKVLDLLDPANADLMLSTMWRHRPGLVIVDSLGMITLKGENHIEDVRGVLTFLAGAAAEFDCGLLLNHHTRKRSPLAVASELTMDDARGCGHIIHTARAFIGLDVVQPGPEPVANAPRRLSMLKTTAGIRPEPLGFELAPMEDGNMYLKYGAAPQAYRAPVEQDKCASWLVDTLEAHGREMKPAEILALAREMKYGERMVHRARTALGSRIEDTVGRRKPGNTWRLTV